MTSAALYRSKKGLTIHTNIDEKYEIQSTTKSLNDFKMIMIKETPRV